MFKSMKFGKRIYELDFLRGIAIIAILLAHAMHFIYSGAMEVIFSDYPYGSYFTRNLYKLARSFFNNNFIEFLANIFRTIFILNVGICFVFSRSNLKRGIKLFIVAHFLTLFTLVYYIICGEKRIIINFGILHALSFAILVCSLLYKFIKNKLFYILSGIVLTAVGMYFYKNLQWIYFDSKPYLEILFGQIVGYYGCGNDSFPGLLVLGVVLIGIYIGKSIYKNKESFFGFNYSDNILTQMGRNSLYYYLFSEIFYPIILYILLILFGFHLK